MNLFNIDIIDFKKIEEEINIKTILSNTPFGFVNLDLIDLDCFTNNIELYKKDNKFLKKITSRDYIIEIISISKEIDGLDLKLNNSYSLIRIKSLSDITNNILLSFSLESYNKNFEIGFQGDQGFLGRIFYDNSNVLSLVIEEEDSLTDRAKNNEFFPNRFCENNKNFINITELGFDIKIPNLLKDELIQFQFCTSYSDYEDQIYQGQINLDSFNSINITYDNIIFLYSDLLINQLQPLVNQIKNLKLQNISSVDFNIIRSYSINILDESNRILAKNNKLLPKCNSIKDYKLLLYRLNNEIEFLMQDSNTYLFVRVSIFYAQELGLLANLLEDTSITAKKDNLISSITKSLNKYKNDILSKQIELNKNVEKYTYLENDE